jgi:hypothetical protein
MISKLRGAQRGFYRLKRLRRRPNQVPRLEIAINREMRIKGRRKEALM